MFAESVEKQVKHHLPNIYPERHDCETPPAYYPSFQTDMGKARDALAVIEQEYLLLVFSTYALL